MFVHSTLRQTSRVLKNTSTVCIRRHAAQFSAITATHDLLVGLHDTTHLAWWSTIPLATLALSLLTLPIAIQSRKNQQTIVALQPILDARAASIAAQVRRQSSTTPATFSRDLQVAMRRERRVLHRRHRVNLSFILALPALKLPLWVSLSLTLRSMSGCSIPYFTPLDIEPLLHSEGIAWMQDLTMPDSLILLPVVFGMLNLINVEVNAAQGSAAAAGRLRTVIERGLRIVSIAFIPIAAQMPAAVCLYWSSSAAITLGQNIWLNRRFPVAKTKMIEQQTVQERLDLPGVDTIVPVDGSSDKQMKVEKARDQQGSDK